MKKYILAAFLLLALGFGLFSNLLYAAKASKSNKIENIVRDKVERVIVKEYSNEDLLIILANIEEDVQNNDSKKVQEEAYKLQDYLEYHKSKIKKHQAKYLGSEVSYVGAEVLEIKYGTWLNSAKIILPLTANSDSFLNDKLLEEKFILSSFEDGEINSARARYISYDLGNEDVSSNLNNLLQAVERGDIKQAKKYIRSIYGDALVNQENKVSLVSKIRDNLVVAKYLLDHNQSRAAKASLSFIDSSALQLIEFKSNSPVEQQTIKELRRELDNVSKVADAEYISKWEKIPAEIEEWWQVK
jgi:hypothetical protein